MTTWDPHEREEAVSRDPSSRKQIYVGNTADVIPLDDHKEEDTADPQYVPGRRRAAEVDPDQADIEFQLLAKVGPSSVTRTVYLDEEGAAPSAPAEESTATSSKGAAAPSAPARSSHSKIPKGFRQSSTPSPPKSVGRPKSAGAQVWFQQEPTHLEAAFPRERTPVHVSIHLQVLTCHLCHKLSSGGIKTHLVLIRLAIASYPRKKRT